MTFTGLQMMRWLAAMLVAVMHITQALSVHLTGQGHNHYWGQGSAGVDIFFVISGFVMGITTPAAAASGAERAQQAWHFLKRRLIRVLPLYWMYTWLKVALLAAVPTMASHFSLDAAHLAASLAFVPWLSPWGEVQPVLPVGWTLNFEMLFYALFALAMLLGAPRLGLCLAVFWLLMGWAQWGSAATAVNFWGSSITLEFVAGVGLARLHTLQSHWRWRPIPPEAGLLAACLGLVLMFGVPWSADDDRFLSWGLAATLLVAGAIWMEPWLQQLRATKAFQTPIAALVFLGDASVSIYLSHTFVAPGVVRAAVQLGLASPTAVGLLAALCVLLAGGLSYALLERPMTRQLLRGLMRPRLLAPAQPTHQDHPDHRTAPHAP